MSDGRALSDWPVKPGARRAPCARIRKPVGRLHQVSKPSEIAAAFFRHGIRAEALGEILPPMKKLAPERETRSALPDAELFTRRARGARCCCTRSVPRAAMRWPASPPPPGRVRGTTVPALRAWTSKLRNFNAPTGLNGAHSFCSTGAAAHHLIGLPYRTQARSRSGTGECPRACDRPSPRAAACPGGCAVRRRSRRPATPSCARPLPDRRGRPWPGVGPGRRTDNRAIVHGSFHRLAFGSSAIGRPCDLEGSDALSITRTNVHYMVDQRALWRVRCHTTSTPPFSELSSPPPRPAA